jgi:hypothetical protein
VNRPARPPTALTGLSPTPTRGHGLVCGASFLAVGLAVILAGCGSSGRSAASDSTGDVLRSAVQRTLDANSIEATTVTVIPGFDPSPRSNAESVAEVAIYEKPNRIELKSPRGQTDLTGPAAQSSAQTSVFYGLTALDRATSITSEGNGRYGFKAEVPESSTSTVMDDVSGTARVVNGWVVEVDVKLTGQEGLDIDSEATYTGFDTVRIPPP